MDQHSVFQTVANDLEAVNTTIHQQLASRVPMVEKIANYIISSGGKRLRPVLVLLSAGITGGIDPRHHRLATVIEFLHTATLLHDDVVDTSDMRRGKPTANAAFGNASSVLVGDFLYARSFELLVALADLGVMDRLANTTRRIAEGEVAQLMNVKNPDVDEGHYMNVITGKTAILFQAAAETSAVLSSRPDAEAQALATYGLNLGLAFQLIDDALDYSGNADTLGKNVGDDLAEGKPTLPLIHAMATGSDTEKQQIRKIIRAGGTSHLEDVLEILHRNGSITHVTDKAHKMANDAKAAISNFPDSVYKEAMLALADIAVERDS